MNVALIGYGYWGKIISQYLKKNFCLKYISSVGYDQSVDIHTILEDSSIKAVFVCTPAHTHYNVVKELLLNGKNVFCEKPLCLSEKETFELVELAENKKLILFTDYIYCYSNSMNFIFDEYCSKKKLKSVSFIMEQFGKFYSDADCFESLAVHFFAVLGLLKYRYKVFDKYILNKIDGFAYDGLPTYGNITISTDTDFSCQIYVSLISKQKKRCILFDFVDFLIVFDPLSENTIKKYKYVNGEMICEFECTFDEKNNIQNVISKFICSLNENNNNENLFISKFVSNLLEVI